MTVHRPVARATWAGLVVVLALAACGGGERQPLAVLADAAGPVERQPGAAAWQPAAPGAKFFLGDAARTGDGTARLRLGTSLLKMDPRTTVRFGGTAKRATLDLDLGAFELEGAGDFGLGMGELTVAAGGGVRVTAGEGGKASLELLLGDATFVGEDGKPIGLTLGQVLDLTLGEIRFATLDARPAIDAGPPDAAPPPVAALSVTVTGTKAQRKAAGATTWSAQPAGASELPAGDALRLGARTSARATQPGVALELASGAELAAGGDPFISLRAGRATVSVDAGASARVAVPGARVANSGAGPGGFALEVSARGTKVTASRGALALVGDRGRLELQRGESATIAKDGAIDLLYEVPRYFDLRLGAGESATVHDPKGATAVQFDFAGACPGGGVVELGRGGAFDGTRQSGGATSANLMVPSGAWSYRVRCSEGGVEGKAVASGKVRVLRDDGRRPLPAKPGTNVIYADGTNWNIIYQNLIPNFDVRWRGATGKRFRLSLTGGKKPITVEGASPSFVLKGGDLADGTYTYVMERLDGPTQRTRPSRLSIVFDNAAPAASIEEPKNGGGFAGTVLVKGVALPGWSASVDGGALPVDRQGRFNGTVAVPKANALAIRLSHPQRGVHYYLRRAR